MKAWSDEPASCNGASVPTKMCVLPSKSLSSEYKLRTTGLKIKFKSNTPTKEFFEERSYQEDSCRFPIQFYKSWADQQCEELTWQHKRERYLYRVHGSSVSNCDILQKHTLPGITKECHENLAPHGLWWSGHQEVAQLNEVVLRWACFCPCIWACSCWSCCTKWFKRLQCPRSISSSHDQWVSIEGGHKEPVCRHSIPFN